MPARTRTRNKAGTAPLKKVTVGPKDIESILADLDVEFAARCAFFRQQSELRSEQINSMLQGKILSLTKEIKNMSIREFCEKYGGDIASVTEYNKNQVRQIFSVPRSAKKASIAGIPTVPRSARSVRKTGGARARVGSHVKAGNFPPPSTPMRGIPACVYGATPRNLDPRLPETPLSLFGAGKQARRPKRGESLMSMNGSPLILGSPNPIPPKQTNKIEIDLSNPNDAADKLSKLENPMEALAALQQQVTSLMANKN